MIAPGRRPYSPVVEEMRRIIRASDDDYEAEGDAISALVERLIRIRPIRRAYGRKRRGWR